MVIAPPPALPLPGGVPVFLRSPIALRQAVQNAELGGNPTHMYDFAQLLLRQAGEITRGAAAGTLMPSIAVSAELVEQSALQMFANLRQLRHPDTCFLLAQWHETGQFGYEISPNQAVELYQVAADANNPAAIFRVGRYKEQAGQLEEAVKLYQQAAIMRDASANHRLGVLLLTGEQGLHADPRSAIEYLRRSADRASRECPDGALMLGKLYLGEYQPPPRPPTAPAPPSATEVSQSLLSRGILYPNPQEGRRLVELSASLGSADAHYLLGRCHEYGLSNFARDPTASLVSYQEAATRNHLDGCLSLAMWCMTGYPHVLEPSEQLALSWCRRAYEVAEATRVPHGRAYFGMAFFYENGIGGCPLDIGMALQLYEIAKQYGSPEAAERLKQTRASTVWNANLIRSKINRMRDDKDPNNCPLL